MGAPLLKPYTQLKSHSTYDEKHDTMSQQNRIQTKSSSSNIYYNLYSLIYT